MAKKGRVYLFGKGENRMNPIHGADLAKVCIEAMEDKNQEIDTGGPEILTCREIAELALEIQGKPRKITSIPVWVMNVIVGTTKFFNRHQGELLAFFTTAGTSDVVAPTTGVHTLKEYYRTLL